MKWYKATQKYKGLFEVTFWSLLYRKIQDYDENKSCLLSKIIWMHAISQYFIQKPLHFCVQNDEFVINMHSVPKVSIFFKKLSWLKLVKLEILSKKVYIISFLYLSVFELNLLGFWIKLRSWSIVVPLFFKKVINNLPCCQPLPSILLSRAQKNINPFLPPLLI